MKKSDLLPAFLLLPLVAGLPAACAGSTWPRDPAVEAARNICESSSGLDYDCVEREAVAALNPEICRLVGIWIDDMCLQAVYEAAGDPAICDRIYLQGVVPNCRAYYGQRTPGAVIPSETPTAAPSPLPTASPMPSPTPVSSPTPLFVFDLTGNDPDLFQPIDVSHNPPLIAGSDDMVDLVFDFANIFCMQFPISCIPKGALYYSYGNGEENGPIPLAYEIVNEMESLVARLPATDRAGNPLSYYAEFAVPEAGYTLRYPVAGAIELFAASQFIPVELPAEQAVGPGQVVYDFFWGYGPGKVRQATYEGYPQQIGPPAMDVAEDGRIALMDPVNERILIFDPDENLYTSFPMPFPYNFNGDLAFDPEGRLIVFDWLGQEAEGGVFYIPYAYRLLPDGQLEVSAPVYVKSASKITKDLAVLDYYDSRLVAPFDPQGEPNSREAQRDKLTWGYPKRYVEGQDPFVARYADVQAGLAFEVHSVSPLGVLTEFDKTPQGYIMTFLIGDYIRGVWIDPAGEILKDVTLPNGQYTEINFNGQVAIAQDGSLYVMNSTGRGIEVHFVAAP